MTNGMNLEAIGTELKTLATQLGGSDVVASTLIGELEKKVGAIVRKANAGENCDGLVVTISMMLGALIGMLQSSLNDNAKLQIAGKMNALFIQIENAPGISSVNAEAEVAPVLAEIVKVLKELRGM